jgi:cell shape-determining protein MreC
MSKKKNKKKNKNKNNNSSYKSRQQMYEALFNAQTSSSDDIKTIAEQIFGSNYFTMDAST